MHDQNPDFSYVDLNRAGVPLIEIVTEPDIRSAEEASVLLTEIRQLVRLLHVSDGNMEEGSLRCDANISIRPKGSSAFGTRCEVKNLNSIRNVRRAIDFEFSRQVALVAAGDKIVQSTLNFDADEGTTAPMREKEEANDYRYFPDPDLAPIHISDSQLDEIKKAMPLLPKEMTLQLMNAFEISRAEALLMAGDAEMYAYVMAALPYVHQKKSLVNWINGPVRALLHSKNSSIKAFNLLPMQLAELINLIDEKKISQQNAIQELLPILNRGDSVKDTAIRLNLIIEENTAEIEGFIDQVLSSYASQVAAYKSGKKGVLGLFVGEVMKLAKGKADAKKISDLIIEKLKKI
ncbi:Aspartyl/glutamyl-tRNA(Asn/Gln) amidotransferase subunit B [compost metagenome]